MRRRVHFLPLPPCSWYCSPGTLTPRFSSPSRLSIFHPSPELAAESGHSPQHWPQPQQDVELSILGLEGGVIVLLELLMLSKSFFFRKQFPSIHKISCRSGLGFFPSLLPGTAVMENKHISTWHYEPWNCPLSPLLALSFPFILLPAAHPSRSFWGPLAAVPIIHYRTQHPHQALANLYSSAKTQREEERGRGLVKGQILSLCLFGPLTKSKAKRPPPRG
ncbi:hypothetical protein PO909_003123 [Leuciscus waleckii]